MQAIRIVQLADQLLGPTTGSPRLTPVIETAAIRAAIPRFGGLLSGMADKRSTQQSLVRLFRELRQLEIDVEAIDRDAIGPTARAALDVYRGFQRITDGYFEPTSLRDAATQTLWDSTTAARVRREVGAVILYLPTRLDPSDVRLLTAVSQVVPVHAAFPWLDDPEELANRYAAEEAAALADALGVSVARRIESTEEPASNAVRVVRAPDPTEEVREIVRRVCADVEAGVPLHHIAVLYRQTDPYAAITRESLDLAGLPWSGIEGRSLAETAPGRALLTTLRLVERQFARDAVLAWVDACPTSARIDGARTSAWDRISRKANVVRGADQWAKRLGAYAATQDEAATQADDEGSEAQASMLRREAAGARSMAATVSRLAAALQTPASLTRWPHFVAWAKSLWSDFVVAPAALSVNGGLGDQQASDLILQAVEDLGAADRFELEAHVELSRFVETLQAAITDRTVPEGRLGEGVLVGPVQATMGLAFDRVYLVGLVEGGFPPTPAPDPFFPVEGDDPTGRRQRQRSSDRRAFLAALAAADGGMATLATPESLAGRAAYPSHWLLERVRLELGREGFLDAERFRALSERELPWLRVVRSAQDGVERAVAVADLEDRRIGEIAAWAKLGLPARIHPMAKRADLAIGLGLTASGHRWSPSFSAFDGNVGELVEASKALRRIFDGPGRVSASAMQTWAKCPFSYFMNRVLRVEPTERPGEEWAINALERGSLVHEVLERFFKELGEQGRPAANDAYGPEDIDLITRLAETYFQEVERRGVSGHPLVWEGTRRALMADLRTLLLEDEAWRKEGGWRPVRFEQRFGMSDPDSWPPVELVVDGGAISMHGIVDRVDLSSDGARAHVFDYKTGRSDSYGKLDEDPVVAGTALQLALYAEAARLGLGVHDVSADYWFVSMREKFAQKGIPGAAGRARARLLAVAEHIASGIAGGVFPSVPGGERLETFNNCAYCPYDRVCPTGRDQTWERKQRDSCGAFLELTQLEPGRGVDGAV